MHDVGSCLCLFILSMSAGSHAGCLLAPDSDGHVTIPISWTKIPNSSFESCHTLVSVTIPDTITHIGESAFHHCHSLRSVSVPDSVQTLLMWAFSDCQRLQSIHLGNMVTSLPDYLFSYCPLLSNVMIPDSVVTIGIQALHHTAVTEVVLSDGVTWVGQRAFQDTTHLKSVYIPPSATVHVSALPACLGYGLSLGTGLDMQRGNVTCIPCAQESIVIPDTVEEIGDGAFSYCRQQLKTVTIGNRVQSINASAFFRCDNLTSVYMADNVRSIGMDAFNSNPKLRTIEISSSLTSVGPNAFYGCGCNTSQFKRGAHLCNCVDGSCSPTISPTIVPTREPTDTPTTAPTDLPTYTPTDAPSDRPTVHPTDTPTNVPSTVPTDTPSDTPTDAPSDTPTDVPTHRPTDSPTASPAVFAEASGTVRTKNRAAYTAIYAVGIVAACMGIYTFVYLRYGGIKAMYRRHRGCEHMCSNNGSRSSRCGRTPYGRTSFCRDHLCRNCERREKSSGDVFCEGCQDPIYLNMYDELPDVIEYAVKKAEQEVEEGHAVANPVFDADAAYQSDDNSSSNAVTEYPVKNHEQEVREGYAVANLVFDADTVYENDDDSSNADAVYSRDDDDSYLQCT